MNVGFDHHVDHHANYYNRNFEFLEFVEYNYLPVKDRVIPMPENFEKMIELAKNFPKGIDF